FCLNNTFGLDTAELHRLLDQRLLLKQSVRSPGNLQLNLTYILVERRLPCSSEAAVAMQNFPRYAASTALRSGRKAYVKIICKPTICCHNSIRCPEILGENYD